MSRKIDTSNPGSLSTEDILYLQERDRLPAGVDPIMDPRVVTMAMPANIGTVTNNAPDGGSSIDPAAVVSASATVSDTGTYEDLTVSELKDEVDRRNDLRGEDEQLSKPGKKADLIAVLEADDDDQALIEES